MRVITLIGDIYEVKLGDKQLAYFQFIGKDKAQLQSDVIRVFRGRYSRRPIIDDLICEEVECYLHTFIKLGIKMGFWTKVGHSSIFGSTDIWFRSSSDYGKYPGKSIVSDNWTIWNLNDATRVFVGKLPKKYYKADIGLVDPPPLVIQRLVTRKDVSEHYPLYK